MQRIIMHVDMDAFYAAIEQRDHPEYRGLPVIVGADPKGGKGRGVVSTASYEARVFGVHSALPISQAYRRCPQGIFLPVRGHHYAQVSQEIMAIFHRFSPLVEPLSLDEAFIDLSGSQRLFGQAEAIGREIKAEIHASVGLTASVGLGPNKLIAKIASDLQKPDGLVCVAPREVKDFLRPMPVRRLWGIGPKCEERLARLGIKTLGDLQDVPGQTLCRQLGTMGAVLAARSRGEDPSPVLPLRDAKSVSNELTFDEDTSDAQVIHDTVVALADKVAYRLRKEGVRGRTVTLKIRFQDFSTKIRHSTLASATDLAKPIREEALRLLMQEVQPLPVRLLGVGVTQLAGSEETQEDLFSTGQETQAQVAKALDQVRRRFGFQTIRQGAASVSGGIGFPKGRAPQETSTKSGNGDPADSSQL